MVTPRGVADRGPMSYSPRPRGRRGRGPRAAGPARSETDGLAFRCDLRALPALWHVRACYLALATTSGPGRAAQGSSLQNALAESGSGLPAVVVIAEPAVTVLITVTADDEASALMEAVATIDDAVTRSGCALLGELLSMAVGAQSSRAAP